MKCDGLRKGISKSTNNTTWFKRMDSILYVYISWTIDGMWINYITFERGNPMFSHTITRALVYCTAVQQDLLRAKWLLCSTRIFSFVSSLKLSRRLPCSVRFVFVSTFNLQRGRAFVVGITNLSNCLCKGKSSGRPRVSEENVRRIQESFECSPRKSTRRASRELGIPQSTVWSVLWRRLLFN